MKLEGEAAQTPPWGGYTVTTRALDLMDAYNELINQGARNAGENKLDVKYFTELLYQALGLEAE